MKLVIQIPCHDEEETLAATIRELPRVVEGFDAVEVLVVDDGSTDATADVARRAGADHVVRHAKKEGLARAFAKGLDASLRLGADVIVNTDGDNQYLGREIEALVRPIVDGKADIVVGDRAPRHQARFAPSKRVLSRFGSWVVGVAAGADVPDAASGFRALSKDAALRMIVESDFTYTHETLIQASRRRMAIEHVPVETRATPRASRLAKSSLSYITSSAGTIARTYTMYRPLRVFATIGVTIGIGGLGVCARFLYFYFTDGGRGHVQSLLLGTLLIVLGFGSVLMGMLADVIAGNRRLLEELLWRVRTLEVADRSERRRDVRVGERREDDVGERAGSRKESIEIAQRLRS